MSHRTENTRPVFFIPEADEANHLDNFDMQYTIRAYFKQNVYQILLTREFWKSKVIGFQDVINVLLGETIQTNIVSDVSSRIENIGEENSILYVNIKSILTARVGCEPVADVQTLTFNKYVSPTEKKRKEENCIKEQQLQNYQLQNSRLEEENKRLRVQLQETTAERTKTLEMMQRIIMSLSNIVPDIQCAFALFTHENQGVTAQPPHEHTTQSLPPCSEPLSFLQILARNQHEMGFAEEDFDGNFSGLP